MKETKTFFKRVKTGLVVDILTGDVIKPVFELSDDQTNAIKEILVKLYKKIKSLNCCSSSCCNTTTNNNNGDNAKVVNDNNKKYTTNAGINNVLDLTNKTNDLK